MLLDKVKRHKLDNGLTLLTVEMREAPIVSTWAWFRVGSRNERPGITGISHWVEHMLFKGGREFGKGEIFKQVAANGGMNNGFTSHDYTAYFETLPADRLDLGLRIERDRMVEAIVDPDEVASERNVIISEREGAENYPWFLLNEAQMAAAFTSHPYRWEVIGWKADLKKITREDLYGYYRKHYAPDNAVLVITGDFKTDEVVERVGELYGGITHSSSVDEIRSQEPMQRGERRVTVKGPGNVHYLSMSYHIPEYGHEAHPALKVLNGVLSGVRGNWFSGGSLGAKTSRLYRALVEKKLATDCSAGARQGMDPFLQNFWATAAEGIPVSEVEKVLNAEIAKIRDDGITEAELAKVKNLVDASLNYSFDGPTETAFIVGAHETLGSFEDIKSFHDAVQQVTCEDVIKVANEYLVEDNRTVGTYVPTGLSGQPVIEGEMQNMDFTAKGYIPTSRMAEPGGSLATPSIEKRKTESGIKLLVSENFNSEAMAFRFTFRAGSVFEGEFPAGTAAMTAESIVRGTGNRKFQEIFEQMDSLGASLDSSAGQHGLTIWGKCLASDFRKVAEVVADIIQNPLFPGEEVEIVRGQILNRLRRMENNTQAVAAREVCHELFEEGHPYRRMPTGYIDTVEKLTPDELKEYHRKRIRPDRLIISIAGGIRADDALEIIEKNLGKWQVEGKAEAEPVLDGGHRPGVHVREVHMPGKTQCDIAIAFRGLPRNNDNHESLAQAINVFGQLGLMGRIGKSVRDEEGLAYYSAAYMQDSLGENCWMIFAGVNPDGVEKAKGIILSELRKMRGELITEEENKMLKDNLTGRFPLMFESLDRTAWMVESPEFYGLPDDYYEKYIDIVRAVSREEILEAAEKFFDPENYAMVIAGPVDEIKSNT